VLSVVDCSETVVNCTASINRITENDEREKMGKETVMICFKVLFQYSPGEIAKALIRNS
jgi:hypothetical protein